MWRTLYFQNPQFEQGIQRILTSGMGYIDHDTGLIRFQNKAMQPSSNWLFFGYTTALRDCFLWHSIMFNHFHLVPEFCRLRCYKVVVKVRNFIEAIKFRNVMLSAPLIRADLVPMHGKVGMDERWYSSGSFNGFVYCDGLNDALEKYQAVRELVSTQLSPDIEVIIKRTCTEFEREYGPTDSPFWQSISQEDLDLQHHLEDIMEHQQSSAVQPDWVVNKTIARFAKWANSFGDKSWIEYFGQDFLTMKAVTYHHLIDNRKGESTDGSG